MNLTGKQLKATYQGVVTTGTTAGFTASTTTRLYDGVGNASNLELGPSGINVYGSIYVNSVEFNGAAITSITYANLVAGMSASSLKPGVMYNITDRKIFLQALSENTMSKTGTCFMYCPSTYATETDVHGNNWLGVWATTLSPSVDDLCIWGGKVWKNLTGDVGASNGDLNLNPITVDWDPIYDTSFTNNEYTLKQFGVEYDIQNDWVCKQWDTNGNVFGIDYHTFNLEFGLPFNPCDISDWNRATEFGVFSDNECLGIWNNSTGGWIHHNRVPQGIYDNSNVGQIAYNHCVRITGNSNVGDISRNIITSTIIGNSHHGNILENTNIGGIYDFYHGTVSFHVQYNSYPDSLSGGYSGVINTNVDGRYPKVIGATAYTLLPWDWNNVYTANGETTVTVPDDLNIPHSSIHTAIGLTSSVIFTGSKVVNYNGDDRTNGRWAVASIIGVIKPLLFPPFEQKYFILGGNTQ
jgi:hypothetical protein